MYCVSISPLAPSDSSYETGSSYYSIGGLDPFCSEDKTPPTSGKGSFLGSVTKCSRVTLGFIMERGLCCRDNCKAPTSPLQSPPGFSNHPLQLRWGAPAQLSCWVWQATSYVRLHLVTGVFTPITTMGAIIPGKICCWSTV